jgi:two-component system KDP operon response regulator KdpE
MANQLIETLLVSADAKKIIKSLGEGQYHILSVKDTGKAMETLRDTQLDLILLDDRLLKHDTTSVVKEIKRRVPLVAALVLSSNADAGYQTDLLEAGADDVLLLDISGEEFNRRLRLILRQRRHAQTLAQRNQHLQAVTLMSRRMHSATEPLALIQDSIDIASRTFKLYGIAIVLPAGDAYQMIAGREGAVANNLFYESIVYLKDYDPFRRVIQSGIVQVFQNIVTDPYFMPIPALPAPESAIILPLNYQEHKLGAMGVFGTGRNPLGQDDLVIYELLASQFAVALHNARHYHSQRIAADSGQRQLLAWRRFISLQTDEEIAETLRQLVDDIPNVNRALVWLYNANPAEATLVKSDHEDVTQIFYDLEGDGHIASLVQQLDTHHMQPITLQPARMQSDPIWPLLKVLKGQQMMVVPIMDSARFIGGIIANVSSSRQYSSDDSKLLTASLAHAAATAMERTTLIQDMIQKSARLETLLRSTSQAIFFLDDTGAVAFCNPQFTELTGISPSEVLGFTPDILLSKLADQASDPQAVLNQLQEAIARLQTSDPELHEDYPIVEISLEDSGRDIHVEFMQIGEANKEEPSWAGIIRDMARYKRSFGGQAILLDVMSERIRVPYAQVRGLVQTLNEQHSRFTHRERTRFIRELEDSVEQMGRLWDNILEMYQLQASGLALNRDRVDLYDLVLQVLESRAFSEYRRSFQIEAPANLPQVDLDEIRIQQALSNVFYNALQFSPRGAAIHVTLEPADDTVRVAIHDQGIGIPSDQLERVFEPFFQASNNTSEEGTGLGLFLAREVIHRHGGNMWIESSPGSGTSVFMTLPIKAAEGYSTGPVMLPEASLHRPAIQEAPRRTMERVVADSGRRVSERPMQTIMIVEGHSKLTARLKEKMSSQDYEIISYRSGEEALRDINAVRLDLIFLDVNLAESNGLDICERMCKRTEVPIIMLANESSEPEKVRALMIGADDYIANPISDEELMARINVIFKRRRIPDRTREPLDLGNLYIDFARREVFLNNKPLELTRIEYDLLHTLAVNQGQVLTHKQLLEKVWGPEYQAETQYLWVNVSRLRKKLEPTPDSPRFIHTQPGVGYVFRPS